jgi:hypothetical protein
MSESGSSGRPLGRVEAGAMFGNRKGLQMEPARTVRGLEREVAHLRREVERYRTATEAGLEGLDASVGWLGRNGRTGLARDLRRNVVAIRRTVGPDTPHG